jgi:hypothetical protein
MGADRASPHQLAGAFEHDWTENRDPRAYHRYLVQVRSLVEEQQIPVREAAESIAGTMFIPGVDADPLREEITIVAGSLETDQFQPGHTWSYLVSLINELGKQVGDR